MGYHPAMPVVEIARFRLAAGAAEQSFLNENRRVQAEYMPRQAGFVSRQLARSDGGEWVAVVHWRNAADADAGAQGFMAAPATQGFMKLLDPSSMTIDRYEVVG